MKVTARRYAAFTEETRRLSYLGMNALYPAGLQRVKTRALLAASPHIQTDVIVEDMNRPAVVYGVDIVCRHVADETMQALVSVSGCSSE